MDGPTQITLIHEAYADLRERTALLVDLESVDIVRLHQLLEDLNRFRVQVQPVSFLTLG